MKTPMAPFLYGSLAALIATHSAYAETHAENPDAGVTEATAQVLLKNIDRVTGILKPGTTDAFDVDPIDVDVFCFRIEQPVANASIQLFASFDSNILLLREGFYGVWGDDGGGVGGAESGIITDLAAGTYYVAVGRNNIGPFQAGDDDAGDYVWDNDSGELLPSEAAIKIAFIGSEGGTASANDPYEVRFNFLTSEDAATAALRATLEKKIKKTKKLSKKAKRSNDAAKAKKYKKVLKRLKKRIKAL